MAANKNAAAWPSIDAGTLRHQVQIQSSSSTPDEYGQLQQSWTTARTTWASIEQATQRELDQAGQLTSQVTHVITVRYTAVAVSAGMRVLFGSHTYLIQAVSNFDQRNIFLKLYVLELNPTE